MSRPLLLLDVEGVLNPFDFDEPPPGFVPHGLVPGEEIMVINPQHGIWLDELAKLFDVIWVTSWNDEANRLLAPLLDIDPDAMLILPDDSVDTSAANLRIIATFASGRATCWIAAGHGVAGTKWAEERSEPTLLLTVSPKTGLTSEQVDAALGWAGTLRRSRSSVTA